MAAIVKQEKFSGCLDNFVLVGFGKEKNLPIPFSGVVSAEWWSMGRDYMQFEDGRVFSRADSYYKHSPYGWRKE